MKPLATHLVAEFGRLYPAWNLDLAGEELSQDAGEGLPLQLVAIENRRAVGIVSIISDDEVTGWEDKDWWLANVFVVPEFRGKGIGISLITRAVELARESGATDLHLVTDTVESWYLNQGWKSVGIGHVHGHQMIVMHLDLLPCHK